MAKEDTSKNTKTKGRAAAKAEKDEDEESGSEEIELEEVTEKKKGEPDDNLRRRAEWFQKRTGG